MRKSVLLACTFLALSAASARAQEVPSSIAFPGSVWITAGHVGPAERDNVLGAAGFEQGVTVWEKGNWFLIPHINVSYMTDADGYDWNNRRPGRVAVKLVRRIPGGIVQAGAGMMVEPDAPSDAQRYGTAFADYWTGWTGELHAQRGVRFGAFPGHAWASSGFISGRDPHNWITSAAVQQGVVVLRHSILSVVPYAEAGANFDSKRRPWENRLRYDAGVKLVRPVLGGVIEAGVAQRRQHEPLSDRVDSAPVAYVNLWIGWNPRTLFHRD